MKIQLTNINDMNKTLKRVADGDTVNGRYTISDGVTAIGWRAFEDCISLKKITIPDGVTEIGDYAFNGCKNLESINIPDSVTEIGWYAFKGCTGLRSISLPKNLGLANYVFDMCSADLQVEYR